MRGLFGPVVPPGMIERMLGKYVEQTRECARIADA